MVSKIIMKFPRDPELPTYAPALQAGAAILFHLFNDIKFSTFDDFFHPGNQKNISWSQIWWMGWMKDKNHVVSG